MRSNSSIVGSLLLAGSLILLGGCSKNAYSPTSPSDGSYTQQPNTVVMSSMSFSPASLTVTKNTTVTWKNNDSVPHTSTSNSGIWNTGNIAPGGSATTIFANTGTFPYHCAIHSGMTGTITVQ